jgi:hypothetical protein
MGLFTYGLCMQWERGDFCVRCVGSTKVLRGTKKEPMIVDKANRIPHHVKLIMEKDELGFEGQLCGDCVPMFDVIDLKKSKTICAVCGGNIRRDSNKSLVQTTKSLAHWQMRRFAANGDVAHKACVRMVTKTQPVQSPPKREHPVLELTVDTGRDKKALLSPEEDKALAFFLSCKKAQNNSTFTSVAVPRPQGGGTGVSVVIVPVTSGKSSATMKRAAKSVVDHAKVATKKNKHLNATDVIAHTALHTAEGKKSGLISPEDQKPLDLEQLQAGIRGSERQVIRIAGMLKKANHAYNMPINELKLRKKERRLGMEYSRDNVPHPEYNNKTQTVYTKRCRDMCNIVAQRHSILFGSEQFTELNDIKVGGAGSVYWSLAVCAKIINKTKQKLSHFFNFFPGSQYDAGGGSYKAILQPRSVLTPASTDWATIIGHMYRGKDLKAKLDGKENLRFLMNTKTDNMAKTIAQQYHELNESELWHITVPSTPGSAMVIPKKFAKAGLAPFCIPHHLVNGHVMFPKLYTAPTGEVKQRDKETYLNKWLPVVNEDGYADHAVLTHAAPADWREELLPAGGRVAHSNGFQGENQYFGIPLCTPFSLLDNLWEKYDMFDQVIGQLDGLDIMQMKNTSKQMKVALEQNTHNMYNNMRVSRKTYMQYDLLTFSETKEIHPPIKVEEYPARLTTLHQGNVKNKVWGINWQYKRREVHCNQASDMAALTMHAGMTVGGNITCPCCYCTFAKKQWQTKRITEEEARAHTRTNEFTNTMLRQIRMREIVGNDPMKPIETKNVAFDPILIPDDPNKYTCPIPLHITLGLGNDIREMCLKAVRLLDGDVGKMRDQKIKEKQKEIEVLETKITSHMNCGKLLKENIKDLAKMNKSKGIKINELKKQNYNDLGNMEQVALDNVR